METRPGMLQKIFGRVFSRENQAKISIITLTLQASHKLSIRVLLSEAKPYFKSISAEMLIMDGQVPCHAMLVVSSTTSLDYKSMKHI